MTHSRLAPLHRLLKRRETTALLGDFEGLLPGYNLALIGANGRLFAGGGQWSQAELAGSLVQASGGQSVDTADVLLQPLVIESQLMGVLGARRHQLGSGPGAHPHEKHALGCLGRVLMALLVNALETRDVVDEALERYREVNLLYHIGETIGANLDPQEVTSLVLGEAQRFIQADAGMVLLPTTPPPAVGAGPGDLAIAESDKADSEIADLTIRGAFGAAGHTTALQGVSGTVTARVFHTGQPAIVTPPFLPTPLRMPAGSLVRFYACL